MKHALRIATLAAPCILLLAAFASPAPAGEHGGVREYRVMIVNLTDGQPFTPPVVATHRGMVKFFTVGEGASKGVQEIAENGNNSVLLATLEGNSKVDRVLETSTGPLVPPGLPGSAMFDDRVRFRIQARQDTPWISFVGMLICTNDGFSGRRTLLPEDVGDRKVRTSLGYDAGTEINTEDFADIVPPCPALTGVTSSDPGTGATNPALAEGGVIHHHDGIQGGADLRRSVHNWDTGRAVIRIVIERIA